MSDDIYEHAAIIIVTIHHHHHHHQSRAACSEVMKLPLLCFNPVLLLSSAG